MNHYNKITNHIIA